MARFGAAARAWGFALAVCLMLCIAPPAPAEQESQEAQEQTQETAEYYGEIGTRMTVRRWGSEKAEALGTLEAGTIVDVYAKGRTWTRIDFGGQQGYVLTKYIERVQRKNPFDGPMPGVSRHVAVGYVLRDTSFLPEGYRYPIAVSEGAWLSVEEVRQRHQMQAEFYADVLAHQGFSSVTCVFVCVEREDPADPAQPLQVRYRFGG